MATQDVLTQYLEGAAPFMAEAVPTQRVEYVAPAPRVQEEAAQEETSKAGEFLKGIYRGVDNLQALGAGAAGLIGDAIGADLLRDWGFEEYKEQIQQAAEYTPEVASFRDIDSSGAFVSYLMGTLGELAPSVGQALLTGGVAGFAGKAAAKKFISKAVSRLTAQGMSKRAATAQAMKEFGKTLTGKAVTRALPAAALAGTTGAQEAGGMWAEDAERYGVDAVPRERLAQAVGLGAISGGLELFGVDSMWSSLASKRTLKRFLGDTITDEAERRLMPVVAKAMAKGAIGESTTEAAQEALSAFHKEGLNISEESLEGIIESAVKGAIGGAGFGAVGGALQPRSQAELQDVQPTKDVAQEAAQEYDNEQVTGDKGTSYEEAIKEAERDISSAQAVISGEDKSAALPYEQKAQQVRQAHAAGQIDSLAAAAEITRIEELKTSALESAIKDAKKQESQAKTRLGQLQAEHRHFSGRKARSRVAWENTQLQQIDAARSVLSQQLLQPTLSEGQRMLVRQDMANLEQQVAPLVKRIKEVPDLQRMEVAEEVAAAIAPVAPVPVIERLAQQEEQKKLARKAQAEVQGAWAKLEEADQARVAARRASAQPGVLEGRARFEKLQAAQQASQQRGFEYVQQREKAKAEQARIKQELDALPKRAFKERQALRKVARDWRIAEREATKNMMRAQKGVLRAEPRASDFGGYAPFVDERAVTPAMRMEPTVELAGPARAAQRFEGVSPKQVKKVGPGAKAKKAIYPGTSKSEPVKTILRQKLEGRKRKVTVTQVNQWAKNTLVRLPQLRKRINVVENASDPRVPERLRSELKGVKAAFIQDTGQIYIFADKMKNKTDVVQAVIHEGVAHFGLRTIMSPGERNKFMRVVYDTKKDTPKFKALIESDSRYSKLSQLDQAEEYIALIAERQKLGHHLNKSEKNVLARFKEFIKSVLQRLFGKKQKITDKEINNVISAAIFNLAKEKGGKQYRKEWYGMKNITQNVRAQTEVKDLDKAIRKEERAKTSAVKRTLKELKTAFKGEVKTSEGKLKEFSVWDVLRGGLQDTQLRLKQVQQYIYDDGNIERKKDAYEVEKTSHNEMSAEFNTFWDKLVSGKDGLIERILETAQGNENLDTATSKVALLAYAMHAPERNQHIGTLSSTLGGQKVAQLLGDKAADRFDEAQLDKISDTVAKELGKHGGKRSSEMAQRIAEKTGISTEQATTLLTEAKKGGNYAGSGWSNEEASRIYKDLWTPERYHAVEKLKEINDYRLQLLEEEGLVKPGLVKEWRDTYQWYVPLKDWDNYLGEMLPEEMRSELTRNRAGKGKGGKGTAAGVGAWKASQAALGRSSTAADPLAMTIAQVQDVIAIKHKNRVGKAFLEMVEENPDMPELWVLEKHAPQKYKNYINRQTGGIDLRRASSKFTGAEGQVLTVMRDGEPVRVLITDERLARALKGSAVTVVASFLKPLRALMRFMSKAMTSWNPDFWPTNAMRDLILAAVNLGDVKRKYGFKGDFKRKLLTEYITSQQTVFKAMLGKKTGTEYDQWFEDFRARGAFTEMYGVKDYETLGKDINKEVKLRGTQGLMGDTKRLGRMVGEYIEATSTSLENTTRLIAFKHITQQLMAEKNYSKEQAMQVAASEALDLTVNFTKKGDWSPAFGSLYLFFNAAMQSNARLAQTIVRKPSLLPTLAFGAYIFSYLAQFMGGDDDNGKSYYSMIPDWEKNANLILMLPGTEGEYVKIPIPYGINIMQVFGQTMQNFTERALDGTVTSEDASKVILETTASLFNNFNPMGDTNEGWTMLLPSVVRPAFQLATNKDFFGKPIYPDSIYLDRQNYPDSQKYWNSVNPILRIFAEGLNSATLGSKYTPGFADVSPESMEHMLNSYLGGIAKTALSTVNLFFRGAQGAADTLELREYPLLRRFGGKVKEVYALDEQYRNVRKKIVTAENYLEGAKLDNKPTKAVREKYRQPLALRGSLKATESRLRAIYKAQKSLRESYFKRGTLSYSEYYKRKEALQERKLRALNYLVKAAERKGVR